MLLIIRERTMLKSAIPPVQLLPLPAIHATKTMMVLLS
jgi:hypothetical protein